MMRQKLIVIKKAAGEQAIDSSTLKGYQEKGFKIVQMSTTIKDKDLFITLLLEAESVAEDISPAEH